MPNYRTNEDRRLLKDQPRPVNVVHDSTIGDEDSGATEVVTLAEIKHHARVEGFTDVDSAESAFTYDDDILTEKISTAREVVELESDVLLSNRSVTAYITNENGGIKLPWGPITGTVTGTDEDLVALTEVKTFGGQFPILLTTGTRMILSYTGGYGTGECPKLLKEAVIRWALYLYFHRGEEIDEQDLCGSASKLVAKFKKTSWLV